MTDSERFAQQRKDATAEGLRLERDQLREGWLQKDALLSAIAKETGADVHERIVDAIKATRKRNILAMAALTAEAMGSRLDLEQMKKGSDASETS